MLDPSRHEPDRLPRLARAAAVCGATGKLCPAERATQLLEAIIQPGDRVAIEGDNQKQADFLAAALAKADPAQLHDLHMVQSGLALPLVHLNEAHPDLGRRSKMHILNIVASPRKEGACANRGPAGQIGHRVWRGLRAVS